MMNNEVKSAARILELLELLARSPRPLSLKDVVTELGYPKSSAYGLLMTLVARGYAVREEPESYRLNEACRNGPGWTGGRDAQLIAVAQPIMQRLRDELGETVFLGVRGRGGRVKTIAKSVSRQSIRYDAELSTTDPAYCTAMGRVLLAFWEPRLTDEYLARERLVRHTEFTVIDRVEIRRLLREVRQNGFAICDQELEISGSGVAAPVRDQTGAVVATLNLATVSPRFAAAKDAMIKAVVGSAQELSRSNGFRN